MARAIGVDIGDRTIKVVELSGSSRSFKVQRVAIRDIPDEGNTAPVRQDDVVVEEDDGDAPAPVSRSQRIAEVVEDIFKTYQLPKEDACTSFHARRSMIREINVPFFEEDQIRKVVRFEAENHLHSQSIDDVVVNWIKTGETKDGSRLTIFASPKDDLADHIALLRRAGVDPAAVTLDATALYTALDGAGLLETNPNCIVLHVGATSTNLILISEGRPRVFRSFPLGVGSLENDIAGDLGVQAGESRRQALSGAGARSDDLFVPASDLPAAEGTPDSEKSLTQLQTDVVLDRRTKFVNKLHRELIRSLAAVRTEAPPERLLLTGGGSLVPGVGEALAERFGLPVEGLDLFDHIEAKDRGNDPEYAGAALGPAIGCALRMLGRNPLGIDLLQDEFSPRNTFDVVRTALATLLTLAFVGVALLTVGVRQELNAEKREYQDRFAVAKHVYRHTEVAFQRGVESKEQADAEKTAQRFVSGLAGDPNGVRRIRKRLQSRHGYLQGELGLSAKIPKLPSALEVQTEFYKALQINGRDQIQGYFRVEQMSINPRRMQARIIVDTPTQIDKARQLLETSPYFRGRAKNPNSVVDMGTTTPMGDKKQVELSINFAEDF